MHLENNISLKNYNTFGIDVIAEKFCAFSDYHSLAELLEYANDSRLTVLGGGSNILLIKNVEGLVIKNEIPGIKIISETNDHVFIKSGAGVNWHSFVLFCINNNYAGVENLALIPGNVGASPMQNIGAYGVELKDVFNSLTAVDIQSKQPVIFQKEECRFGYRESIFKKEYKNRFIITDVTFRLFKKPRFNISYGAIESELEKMKVSELSLRAVAEAVMNIRRSKLPDPSIIGNAGSFFKNPEVDHQTFDRLKNIHPGIVSYPSAKGFKLAAAWLIEQCGWKGYRKEDAGCHEKQPLVLVNYGHASGSEIFDLSTRIMESVETKFGITLEREVNVIQ